VKWINVYYLKEQDIMTWQTPHSCSWILKRIVNCREIVMQTRYWDEAIQRGKYKTSTMYKDLRGEKEQVEWKRVFFNNHARPRATFILWLTLMACLPTKDRLARIGVVTDGVCSFCNHAESLEHIFFECNTTQLIWREILSWVGFIRSPSKWSGEKTWLIQETKKKGWRRQILKIAAAETIYAIWRARNVMIFFSKMHRSLFERYHNI
jgi:hypothetical protein